MDEEQKTRNELLAKYRDDILRRQLSNNENYDKAVLSLGTGFLGFSMAFLKDFVSYKNAVFVLLLPSSWGLFCFSIIATIASFFLSQKGLTTQLHYAEKYYLENDESFLTKKNIAAKWTDYANYSSAISFILAIVLTIFFVVTNLVTGVSMSNKQTSGIAQDGACIPRMQQLNKGASIPSIQPTPSGAGSSTSATSQPGTQSSSTAQNSSTATSGSAPTTSSGGSK